MNFTERRSMEFKALQDEMLENSKKIYQIITSTIGLCAGLIGYCFSTAHFPIIWARPFALLSPFLILVPAMILIQSNQLSTVRIAGYLKIAFEDYQDQELPGWQTALQWCRQHRDGPKRIGLSPETSAKTWTLLKKRLGELTFLRNPATSSGRHLHVGLRGILYGIALASTLGSFVAWWWLLHHDDLQNHPHICTITFWYILTLLAAWWLFLLALRDMRDGWQNERFFEWQEHWRKWVRSLEN